MRLHIISEPLDIFHRNTFLDPVGPSFKFDRHARETVGWRRRDPPKEAFLVDDERDGFTRRQRCASISLCFLVCHHGSLLPCGPLCEDLHVALCVRTSTISRTVLRPSRGLKRR